MKKELFNELCQSLREAGAIRRGEALAARVTKVEPAVTGVKRSRINPKAFAADAKTAAGQIQALRESLRLSQAKFSALLGISVDTLQNWEQGRRSPTGPAKVLLKVAALHPEVILEVA